MSGSDPDNDDVPVVTASDPYSALHIWLADQLMPDQMSDAEGLISDLLTWATGEDGWAADNIKSPAKRPKIGILAGDAYIGVNTVINRDTIRELNAIRAAEAETGIMGMDSAYATYAAALKARGVDTRGLAGSAAAARSMFVMARSKPHRIAADAASVSARSNMFPNADRLSKRF